MPAWSRNSTAERVGWLLAGCAEDLLFELRSDEESGSGPKSIDFLARPPHSVARRPGRFRVAASENALSCLGQRIQQIRGGELAALERGGDGFHRRRKRFRSGIGMRASPTRKTATGAPVSRPNSPRYRLGMVSCPSSPIRVLAACSTCDWLDVTFNSWQEYPVTAAAVPLSAALAPPLPGRTTPGSASPYRRLAGGARSCAGRRCDFRECPIRAGGSPGFFHSAALSTRDTLICPTGTPWPVPRTHRSVPSDCFHEAARSVPGFFRAFRAATVRRSRRRIRRSRRPL